MLKVTERKSNRLITENGLPAYRFWPRFKGLMFQRHAGGGIHLKPCTAIHTFFMKVNIDVVYLDESGIITGIEEHLIPNRIGRRFPRTRSVLELPTGTVSRIRLSPGEQLRIEETPAQAEQLLSSDVR
ncbi:DUF192 domain-containing protein [Bacillus daqingensis]|uniref:DUF192 domain-containing protein n=1 Tax=Bacillus daqingensis TaxID=872396 RepID=A0ABV9NY44_9BACI